MKSRQIAPTLAALALSSLSLVSHAAEQCMNRGPGVYGIVTVSGCESDPENGLINPFSGAAAALPFDGVYMSSVDEVTHTRSCPLTFSHPIITSSVRIMVDDHQANDVLSILTNGVTYAPVAADLAPLPGTPSLEQLQISGTTIIGVGTAIPPDSRTAAGIVSLTHGAPPTLTSLTLNMTPGSGSSVVGVCFDDALPPADPTPVPTQSTAALAGMALMASLLGVWRLRRRAHRR